MCKMKKMKVGSDRSQFVTDDSDESDTDVSMSESDSDSPVEVESDNHPPLSESHMDENQKEQEGEIDEEEDEVVRAIMQEKNKVREHPPDIQCDDFIMDLSFHPQEDILAAASITGDVILYRYTNDTTLVVNCLELHLKTCRAIEFSADGSTLFSSSKDKSIMVSDIPSGKLMKAYENAHDEPIYSLLVMDNNLIASGDDNGTVKLWDLRKQDPVFSLKETDDYVSSLITTDAQKVLVCASGEGNITALNLVARKLHIQSEFYETEFTCMGLVKYDSKLVVGSSKGAIYLFNWGEFAYHSDEFPGLKRTINCLIPITENIVVTACEDGLLRATHLFPHRHLGIVGQHQFSVESLDISNDGHLLASFAHDNAIRFWNIKYFEDVQVNEKEKAKRKKDLSHNLPSSKFKDASDFFSGLV